MKRILALVCAVMLCATLFPACGSPPGSSAPAASNTPAGIASSTSSGEAVPISIFCGDFGRVIKEDNSVVKEVEARTGTKISLTIVPVAEYLQKVNLFAASDSLPDIVRFLQYDHFQYISSGALLDLAPYLDKYPDLKKSQPQEAWDLVTVQGAIYTVPNFNVPGKFSYYMRKDWLDKLDLPVPETLEQLRETLIAFTYNDPDGNGVNDTWGLGTMSKMSDKMKVNPFMQIFGAYGVMPYAYFEKDGKAYDPLLTGEYKQALEYCRMLYCDDKVVDPDVFIIPEDETQQRIVQGKIGSARGWWADICERINDQLKMPEVTPGSEWVIVNNIKGPNGDYGMLANDICSYSSSVAASSKNTDKALELLNFIGSDEGFMLTSYGIEGVHYTVDAAGEYADRTEEGREAMNAKWLDVLSQFVYRVRDYQRLLIKSNPSYEEHLVGARDGRLYTNLFEGISTEVTQKYIPDLDAVALDWFVKFVTDEVSLDQFDVFVAEYKSKGGDAVMESYLQEYNSRKGTSLTAGN